MHLFALLLAATFASDFAALSNAPTFAVTPTTTKFTAVGDVVVKQNAQATATAWTTPVHVAFTLENKKPTEGFTQANPSGNKPDVVYTMSAVNFLTELPEVLPGDTIYVWVMVAAGAAGEAILEEPATITVTPAAFTVTPAALPLAKGLAKGAATFELNANTPAAWAVTTPMQVTISSDPTGATKANVVAGVVVDTTTAGKVTLSLATADWSNLTITDQTSKVYIFCVLGTVQEILDSVPAVVDIIDDFTVLPKKAFQFDTKVLGLKITPTAGSWDTQKRIKVKLANEVLGDKITAGFWTSTDPISFLNGAYTAGDAALGATVFAANTIYVYVAVEGTPDVFTYTMEPMTIAYVKTEFSVTPPSVTDAAESVTGTLVTTADLAARPKENKMKVFILREPVEDPSTIDPSLGVLTAASTVAKTYAFTAQPIPVGEHRLTTDDILYFYASFEDTDDNDAVVWFSHGRTMTVTEDPTAVRFEVSPTTISVDDLQTHDKLSITQILGKPWESVKVQLTLESKEGPAFVSTALDVVDDEVDLLWNNDIKTYLTGAVKGKKITVKVDPQTTPTWAAAGVDVTITAGRLCTIDPAERTIDQWKAGSTFTVTVDGDVQWHTTNSAIVISKTSTHSTAFGTDIVKKGLAISDDREVTVTVLPGDLTTFGEITEPTPLYVFVSTDGSAKDVQAATKLTITKNPAVLEFDVAPKTIELTATEITGLTITPKTVDATWQDPIDFIVTDTLITPDSNTAVTEPGSAAKGSGATAGVWTATAPLSLEDFTLTDGMTLYVYASKSTGGDKLEVADTITVGAAKVPSFAIAPVETTWAAELKTPAITLTPTDVTWPTEAKTNFKAKFSFGTTDPKTAEIAIAVAGTGTYTYTIPKDSSLADLEIAETDLPATVKIDVRLEDGTYMNKPVDFTVKKAGSGAMGVSPLLSLLAALVFLFVKLF